MPEEPSEFSRLLDELEARAREDPGLVGRILDRLGPEGYLVRYVLARRGVVV